MPDHRLAQATSAAAGLGDEFQPLHGDQLEDPYPFYARARDKQPVFFSPSLQAWVVTRYDDVLAIVRDPETFSNRDTLRPVAQFSPQALEVLATGIGFIPTITNTDGSAHRRFRVPLQHAFRPARMRAIEEPTSAHGRETGSPQRSIPAPAMESSSIPPLRDTRPLRRRAS